jgi:hypothetical protein
MASNKKADHKGRLAAFDWLLLNGRDGGAAGSSMAGNRTAESVPNQCAAGVIPTRLQSLFFLSVKSMTEPEDNPDAKSKFIFALFSAA